MESVIIRKKSSARPSFTVGTALSRKSVKGDVGLEIEVEGRNLLHEEGTPSPWVYHHDGSLRGDENAEYVLARPLPFGEVSKALTTLFDKLNANGAQFDDSNRTSVHVHLNCQEFHFNRLTSFAALYFAFEEVLTAYCGDHRVGNLFCLRAVDAPAIVTHFKNFIKNDGRYELRDGLHYSGLNIQALMKFGSLEVRTMRGCYDAKSIEDWVSILRRFYDMSAGYTDPRDICADFSREGAMAFFNDVLGDLSQVVRAGVDMSDDDIRDCMYEGIRLAQDLCYCRDWSEFLATDLKPDPFGRGRDKIVKKLVAAASEGLVATPQPDSLDFEDEYEEEDAPSSEAVWLNEILNMTNNPAPVPSPTAPTQWGWTQAPLSGPPDPFSWE